MKAYYAAPAVLVAAETKFSSRLRANSIDGDTCQSGLFLYRKVYRENISGVLKSVFPIFYQRLDLTGFYNLVNEFIYQHNATEPEFHQIATELLIFIRRQSQVSPLDLALLEYEWLLYAVEIDYSEVPQSNEISLVFGDYNYFEITLNPTLKIISLPFEIKGENLNFDREVNYYYAIYRGCDNFIYQKILGRYDLIFLSHLNNGGSLFDRVLDKELVGFSSLDFRSWLEINNNDGILFLKNKRMELC